MAFRTVGNIEGFPVLAEGSARWPLRAGCIASEESFDMPAAFAQQLFATKGGQPVTLTLESNNQVVKVQGLYIKHLEPSTAPAMLRVRLADRRVFWDRKRVTRSYNIHRNTGQRRTDATGVIEIDPVVPTIQYAYYSLKNPEAGAGGKWTPTQVLEDVLEEMRSIEKDYNGTTVTVNLSPDVFAGSSVEIEQLELEDKVGDALRRVLAYLPGIDLYVNVEGQVVVFSRLSGVESAIIKNAGPPMHARGLTAYADMKWMMPKAVRVLFTYEVEVKHDMVEPESITDTIAGPGDGRTLMNVIRVPDASISIQPRGGGDGYTVAQFTYVDFHQYLLAINADLASAPFGDIDQLDYLLLQQAFVPGMGLWNAFQQSWELNPNADWGARIAALEDSYRQLLILNPRWVDRSKSIKASSILTIDNATGQRGPARAYADFATVPSLRGQVKQWTTNSVIPFVQNHKCYPVGGIITSAAKPARCKVVMEHEDQGVFRFQWEKHHLGYDEQVLPSMVGVYSEGEMQMGSDGKPVLPGPNGNLAMTPDVIGFDISSDPSVFCALTPSWRACVIMTHVPASPNTTGQLFAIEIGPAEAAASFPAQAQGLKDALAGAAGPVLEIRVGGSVETARVPWVDDGEHAALIEKLFGLGNSAPPPAAMMLPKVINAQASAFSTGASLHAIAVASAARAYAQYASRWTGQQSGHLNPGLVPEGRVSEVVHEITQRGEGISTIVLPEDVPALDMVSILPDSARAILLHLPGVDQKRAS